MAAYPLTDAYYLQQQQQQQPPSAAPATVAQAKPGTTAMAAATSIYERQHQPPLQQPQPMLLQSLVLTTAADPNYGQQHQHSQQQQHPQGGTGAESRGCPSSSLRPAQVNILSSVGNVPFAPSHLLSHPNPPLHRPQPPQPERRKQLPEASSSSSSADPSRIDAQVRMPSIVGGGYRWPSKMDCVPRSLEPVEMSASAAAGSASAAAAAFNRRPRKVAPPVVTQPNIPCQQPPVKTNSMTIVRGADDLNIIHLAKTNHRQYQGTTVDSSPISLYSSGAKSAVVANGWSSSSATDRNPPIADDQPLDLTSVKKKRQPEDLVSDDSPLDLSIKKRRLDDGFVGDRQQKPVIDGHQGFSYIRPDTVVSSHEINARLAIQRSLVDQFGGQARVFNLQGGAVLIPPSISGVNTSSRGHRQVHNPPRPKAGHASPRSALFTTNPFPMFQGRTGTTEMSSAYSLNEVPVIRSAVAGFQFLSQSGSQSVVTSASLMSGISGSTNFGRNTTLCQDTGNHVALGQRPRSLLQHQHQQQQHPQPSLSASCSTTPRDNIPNMLRTDQKMGPKDSCTGKGFNELPKYSDLNRASSAAAAPNALELGSHLQATPVIKSLQQQHQGSFSGSKQLAVGAIGCNDVNSKHTLNNLRDTLASVSTTPIPKTSYGVRPNSRSSHAKPRTPRPSVNSQTAPHDASTSSSFFAATSSSSAIVTDQRAHHVDHLRGIDQDLQLTTPKQETYLVGDVTAVAATPKVELTWKPESMPGKSEMSSQGEEESKRRVIQTMQAESPKKTLASGDVESVSAVLSRSYFQQGLASTENNRFTGISPEEMLKGDLVAKTEAICDNRESEEADTMAKTSNTHNWLDSANGSRLSSSNIGALCSEAEKPVDPLNQSYVVRSDILEKTGGAAARSAVQLNKRCEVVKKSETGLMNHTGDGLWAPNEQNVSSIQKLHQCTTKVPIVSADPPPPQESKDEALDKDSSRRVGVAGGCEACKWKESSDQAPPINNSFPKILSPCRNCDPREIPCDGGHTQAPMTFSGDLIPRQCTCRGFDRPGPRRIPVANVQPFMKEPADVAVVKSSADPVQPTLDDVQKPEDAQTDASTVVIDDANAKAAMTSGALKIDSQTVGWTSGDTPHLKEFVKFLEISAANPYRTPDEKLRETHGRGGSNESADCTDRGRVKRQLLMPLAGSKSRSKPTGEAKREGGLVVGCDSKKTPVEYIDEDNCFDPVNGKEKATSEARDSMGRTSTTAENDDSLYGASALYQTMKALDRQQAEDRVKASQMLANSAAFSLSKTDFERKAPADEGATYGLDRASDRSTSDVTVEQRKKKKKQKPKVTNLREATEQLETQRLDDTKSNNIGEQLTKDAHTELASSVASATDEAAASEAAGNSYVAASTSALDEKSVSKPAMKRKYQRKKTKPEELPPRADDGHQMATELTGSKSSPITSMSSSESTEVTPKKKRRRAIELLTQFNPPDEARALDENRLSRSVTDQLITSTTHSSSSILLQVPQFLQQTPAVGSSTGRRRGTSARRAGRIVRHARRSSNYDRNAAYEAELKQEAERRLVRRGHGRGCRAAARHQQRMLSLHRLTDAEPRSDTPNAPYIADDANDHYHRQLQQQQPQSQKVDDETTRDLFEYDDSSDAVFPIRGRGQGRKPVRKNGRIAFQYPEVFGRRRARGGLRGRSRPVRGSDGAETAAVGWGGFDPSDPKDFETDRTHNEEVLNDDQRDSFSSQSISEQVPSAAATISIRGKVRSRVRVGGRGSRGHPRSTHSAPRYDPVPPAATDNRPCPSSALGRDASETRLHQVTRLGYEELVSYYLTTGIIHPNVQDNSGVTPLHDSCSHGYLNITRLLLDHGAHPNSKALDGTRPLHLAVANDHVEIVRLLLSYGADITMTNVTGRSPLQMAKTRDMKQLLKGFSSDLSGGKGKEIPWQFSALFEVGGCDVLADAPADDQIEATEVLFDLGTDNSLPVHRFVSDSQKGPRNFHSVSDLCKDVKVDDFLLLNGDLTYVHVTSAADLPSSTEVASSDVLGHPMPGPSSSSSSSTSLSSLSSSSSLDHQLSTPSVGASTSSASIVSHHHHQQLQQQQHRGWIPLSSSRQRTHCSSVTGVDRSSYVEIDVSLKGLLDIGVHRVPLLAHRDVPCPSRDPFSSRPKRSGDSKDLPRSASGNASLVPSGGSDFSSVSPSSSFASATVHTSKSELANPDDVIASAPSSVEKLTTICDETITGNGQSEQSAMRLDSKRKIPNCLTASPGSPSSVPTPRATPLPHSDQKLESGNSRDNSLEQCRIVLCDIKSPSSSSTDLNSIKCDARKDVDKSTTVIQNRVEEERKKAERKQTVQANEHTVTANASPVRLTSLTHRTTGHVAKASTDLIVPLHNVPASQRPGLGSSERGIANGSSSSGIAAAAVTQRRLAVFGNARRRVVARELVDGVMASKPEASHSESLIPVLEKHGSDDETPPVENEEDVCGESYDDEREMPQLTLYA